MQEIIKLWRSVSEIEGAGWVIGVVGALIIGWVGYYVIMLFRGMATGVTQSTDLLNEFEQLKQQGKLSDDEFERVRASTPLPGEVQEILDRPTPELDPKPAVGSGQADPILPPPRKLTPEESALIRQKLAERSGQKHAPSEQEETK